MTSLIDEWAALAPVPVADWQKAGIPPQAIVACGGIRACRARFAFTPDLGRYFEFDGHGLPCWTVAAYADELLIDLVAWPLDKPMRHARLTRRAWALGQDRALSPNRLHESDPDRAAPVHVRRHPLSWLRAGASGLVILDGEIARAELWHCSEIAGEDYKHGCELQQLMRPPAWRGQVMIPDERVTA